MSTQPTRQKFWPFLKSYLKRSLEVYKHPKQLLPTIILTVVWMVLGIVQLKVKENLPMQVLNFITYAQGGLYGGVVGAIGGILGKVVVAAFVNALIVPLFSGKKPFGSLGEGFKELGKQISFDSKETLAPLLKGLGAAMLIYILFNITARFENSMAGIMAAVSFALALGRKNGFMWDLAFSYANSVSKGKTPSYQNVLRGITGMSLGFALAVALGAVVPSLVSLLGIVALIVGWIMGKGSKKEAAATLSLLLLFTLSQQELRAQDEPSAVSSEGAWVLVDKKTTLSASSYDSGDYDAGNGVLNRVVIENVSGTVEHFEFDGDFIARTPRSWTGGTGYNEASHNKSHAEAAVTPFEGPYRPGEVFEAHYNGKVNGSAIMQIYSNIHLQIFLSYYPGESAMASWQFPNGDDQYWNFTFPTVEEAKGERFTISYRIELVEVVLQIDYIFEWGGRPEMTLGDFSDILWWAMGGEGEHAPAEWTIAIAIIGGFGGAIGAGLGGGLGGGTVPDGNGPLSPEEEEWLRWQKEAEDRRRRYLTDNPDGTRTMKDPATEKNYTLYPTYDEDGNQTGWKNENDTPYSEDSIDEWLDNRERNSDYYKHNEYTGEQNLADQRAKNDARNAADAARGSSAEADRFNKERDRIREENRKKDYLEKLAEKYKQDPKQKDAEKNIRKMVLKNSLQAQKDFQKAISDENNAQFLMDYTGSLQKVCDTGAVVVSTMMGPQGKAAYDKYTAAKAIAGRTAEGYLKGNTLKGMAAGAVEGGLGVLTNRADDVFGKVNTYGAAQVLTAATQKIFSGIYDGKSKEQIKKDVTKAIGQQVVNVGFGAVADKTSGWLSRIIDKPNNTFGSMLTENSNTISEIAKTKETMKDIVGGSMDITDTWTSNDD